MHDTKNRTILSKLQTSLRDELERFADSYYNSVLTIFKKTAKQNRNENRVLALGFFFVFISYGAILGSLISAFNINPDSDYFGLVFVISVLIYLLPIIFILSKIDNKRKLGNLRGEKLAFCHLYRCIHELQAHLTNGRIEHLKNAQFDFDHFLNNSEVNFELEVKELRPPQAGGITTVKKPTNVGEIVERLAATFWWFILNEDATLLVDAYQHLPSKITSRLHQGIEADRLLPCLNNLMLYEYTRIKKTAVEQFSSGNDYSVAEIGKACLIAFANQMKELEDVIEQPMKKEFFLTGFLRKTLAAINDGLMRKSLLVSFLSWYILLIIIFGISIFFVTQVLELDIDSTIIIGLFTAPFVGAIAISTAIFTKTK